MRSAKYVLSLCMGCIWLMQGFGQPSGKKKIQIGAYAFYGRHFSTNYIIDSGSTGLVSKRMPITLEGGGSLDLQMTEKWWLRTGISCHMHFLSEIDYGTPGEVPPVIRPPYNETSIKSYIRGAEYAERVSVSVPVQALFRVTESSKWDLSMIGGVVATRYMPQRDQLIRNTILYEDNGGFNELTNFTIERRFLKRSIAVFEWQFAIEAARRLRGAGAVLAGLKVSKGASNLERADYTIWPQLPQYRSRGHFTLNRSYIGVYLGYRFGKNSSNTRTHAQ